MSLFTFLISFPPSTSYLGPTFGSGEERERASGGKAGLIVLCASFIHSCVQ